MVTDLTKKVFNSKGKTVTLQQNTTPSNKKENKTNLELTEQLCPICKNPLIIGRTAYGCKNFKNCNFKLPFIIFGKKLTQKQSFDLIQKKKTSKIKGFTEYPEQKTEGTLFLNENGEVELK